MLDGNTLDKALYGDVQCIYSTVVNLLSKCYEPPKVGSNAAKSAIAATTSIAATDHAQQTEACHKEEEVSTASEDGDDDVVKEVHRQNLLNMDEKELLKKYFPRLGSAIGLKSDDDFGGIDSVSALVEHFTTQIKTLSTAKEQIQKVAEYRPSAFFLNSAGNGKKGTRENSKYC